MASTNPRVYTYASGHDPLRHLAEQVMRGFPVIGQSHEQLSQWTILVPTRRAARELSLRFFELQSGNAVLLPTIKPIGDVDENLAMEEHVAGDLPPAISPTGLLFVVTELVANWARVNPQYAIAGQVVESQKLATHLAESLVELVHQTETEEVSFQDIATVIDFDLAGHREAILSLLSVLNTGLPAILMAEGAMGPSARRNLMIRRMAERLATHMGSGPIIAAGSTGTNPATRELLRVIAHHPKGAIILPGLDRSMAIVDWLAVGATHPQYGMKQLLAHIGVDHTEVEAFGPPISRAILSREIMRPSDRTHEWFTVLPDMRETLAWERVGLSLVQADDRHHEARTIALILRHALDTTGQTAALITPDRDLARRVKAELMRWSIDIDDTAGESLARQGAASLLVVLIQCLTTSFAPDAVVALLHHELIDFGLAPATYRKAVTAYEMAALRQQGLSPGLHGLKLALKRAKHTREQDEHKSRAIKNIDDDDWGEVENLVQRMESILAPFQLHTEQSFSAHLEALMTALSSIAAKLDWELPENQPLLGFIERLHQDAARLPPMGFADAGALLIRLMSTETLRAVDGKHPRLFIYGLLEARMMSVDIAVLGGLNEGRWPAQPDSGPWLNRPMREVFKLQQPERSIGLTAHDFCEAMRHKTVYLTWSKREGSAPLVPSRWILRLGTLLKDSGLDLKDVATNTYLTLASAIDAAEGFTPHHKPRPKPPVADRPRRYSVTRIETLNRDPYAIYAGQMLEFEPLAPLSATPSAQLRGIVFHDALRIWNSQGEGSLASLEIAGRTAFGDLMDDVDIASFWWPQFRRLAKWLVDQDAVLSQSVIGKAVETPGRITFLVGGETFTLTGRADRIDLLQSGEVCIIDYKTGQLPGIEEVNVGFNPQLPLEAAMVAQGGFGDLGRRRSQSAKYVRLSGSRPPGEIREVKNIMDLAEVHLVGMKEKLAYFLEFETAFVPRSKLKKDTIGSQFDHLSRYLEWRLAETS